MSQNEFDKQIELFCNERRDFFNANYQRSLPFGDLVSDRWGRAQQLGFGDGASVYDSAIIYGNVKVGGHTWVGPQVILDGAHAPLVIGSYCSISCGVQIYTHNTVKWSITGGKVGCDSAPVSIGDCVYIGPNALIVKGVSIGSHVIIGANSYVDRDIPDFTYVLGQPIRFVGKIHLSDDGTSYTVEKTTVHQNRPGNNPQ